MESCIPFLLTLTAYGGLRFAGAYVLLALTFLFVAETEGKLLFYSVFRELRVFTSFVIFSISLGCAIADAKNTNNETQDTKLALLERNSKERKLQNYSKKKRKTNDEEALE